MEHVKTLYVSLQSVITKKTCLLFGVKSDEILNEWHPGNVSFSPDSPSEAHGIKTLVISYMCLFIQHTVLLMLVMSMATVTAAVVLVMCL
jgi:hypothetical protein